MIILALALASAWPQRDQPIRDAQGMCSSVIISAEGGRTGAEFAGKAKGLPTCIVHYVRTSPRNVAVLCPFDRRAAWARLYLWEPSMIGLHGQRFDKPPVGISSNEGSADLDIRTPVVYTTASPPEADITALSAHETTAACLQLMQQP